MIPYLHNVLILILICIFSFDKVETSDLSVAQTTGHRYKGLYNCINLYFETIQVLDDSHDHGQDFPAFQECLGNINIEDQEELKAILLSDDSITITLSHLETISNLFEACGSENRSVSDVEAIVKSDYFLEEFKDFIPNYRSSFKGSSFIWTTLASFDRDFDRIAKKLKVLLDNKFDLFLKAGLSDIISPLNFASQRGMKECVKILLKYEDVNCFDAVGYTPLLYACSQGHGELVNMLLRAGADPLFGLEFNPHPKHEESQSQSSAAAVPQEDEDEISIYAMPLPCDYLLIKGAADENTQLSFFQGLSSSKDQLLKMAYLFGFDAAIKNLNPNATDYKWPHDLLNDVIEKRYFKQLRVFLQEKYMPTLTADTTLVSAFETGNLYFVKLLIEQESDLSTKHVGEALIAASRKGHAHCAKFIFESLKYKVILPEHAGKALHHSSYNGHVDFVKLLLENIKDISASASATALISASHKGHTNCAKLILESRKYNDIFSGYDAKALHYSSYNGHVDFVKLLFENIEDISASAAGEALISASHYGHTNCAKLILESRTYKDFNVLSQHGARALSVAARNDHIEFVKLVSDYISTIQTIPVALLPETNVSNRAQASQMNPSTFPLSTDLSRSTQSPVEPPSRRDQDSCCSVC